MPSFVIANDSNALAQTLYEQLGPDAEFYVLLPCCAALLSKFLTPDSPIPEPSSLSALLSELNIPAHKIGYQLLLTGIPLFAKDPRQSLSKELYPAIADALGYDDWSAIEYSIRRAILSAWLHRDPLVWKRYFPDERKAPSNKVFLATLAEYWQKHAPDAERPGTTVR